MSLRGGKKSVRKTGNYYISLNKKCDALPLGFLSVQYLSSKLDDFWEEWRKNFPRLDATGTKRLEPWACKLKANQGLFRVWFGGFAFNSECENIKRCEAWIKESDITRNPEKATANAGGWHVCFGAWPGLFLSGQSLEVVVSPSCCLRAGCISSWQT